jgi:hypothetical protein
LSILVCSTQETELCAVSTLKHTIDNFSPNGTIEGVMWTFGERPINKAEENSLMNKLKERCTPCVHAAYSVVHSDLPNVSSDFGEMLTDVCGANFVGK